MAVSGLTKEYAPAASGVTLGGGGMHWTAGTVTYSAMRQTVQPGRSPRSCGRGATLPGPRCESHPRRGLRTPGTLASGSVPPRGLWGRANQRAWQGRTGGALRGGCAASPLRPCSANTMEDHGPETDVSGTPVGRSPSVMGWGTLRTASRTRCAGWRRIAGPPPRRDPAPPAHGQPRGVLQESIGNARGMSRRRKGPRISLKVAHRLQRLLLARRAQRCRGRRRPPGGQDDLRGHMSPCWRTRWTQASLRTATGLVGGPRRPTGQSYQHTR
jgi:hypothetical protein